MNDTDSTRTTTLPAVAGQLETPVRPVVERMRRWLDGCTEDTSGELMRLAIDEIEALDRQVEALIYTASARGHQ